VSCGRGCYEIGGPWITCDPECPEHGDEARQRGSRLAELEAENERLKARLVDYDKLISSYDELIDKSRKWYHDSTQWEGDEDLGPMWQDLWDRAHELRKAG
jgi:hypothetical protein